MENISVNNEFENFPEREVHPTWSKQTADDELLEVCQQLNFWNVIPFSVDDIMHIAWQNIFPFHFSIIVEVWWDYGGVNKKNEIKINKNQLF